MISVIIATFNGELVLPKTLQALSLVDRPREGVEFIIVDNASTDGTSDVLREFSQILPLTILFEPRQGKAHAIHKGIQHSSGELIVFSDNDVIPDKDWLISFSTIAQTKTDFAVFLGQVRPYWTNKAKHWLEKLADDGKVAGCTPINLRSGEVDPHFAKGANICVRRSVINTVSFRNDLWVAGESSAGGEDTDFVKNARESGFRIWFISEALVLHIVKPYEMTVKGICMRSFRIGRSIAALDGAKQVECTKRLQGYPRWIFPYIVRKVIDIVHCFLTGNSHASMSKLLALFSFCGQQYQYKKSRLQDDCLYKTNH